MLRTQSLAAEWTPRLLSVLRIVAALLFMEHGMRIGVERGPG